MTDFCCTAYSMVDEEGTHVKNRMLSHQEIRLEDLLKENYICCSSVMLRSQLAKEHAMNGSYAHEDYVYWLELLQSGAQGGVLNQCLTNYRFRRCPKRQCTFPAPLQCLDYAQRPHLDFLYCKK